MINRGGGKIKMRLGLTVYLLSEMIFDLCQGIFNLAMVCRSGFLYAQIVFDQEGLVKDIVEKNSE